MPDRRKKHLMRSVGEFFGHIIRGAKTDPKKATVRKQTEEEDRGNVVLRRTTIEEIEFRDERR